jgi:hypothetical protein
MVPIKLMIANSRKYIYLCKSNWKEGGNIHMYMDTMIPKISFFLENKKRKMSVHIAK